jgi:sporulation protein YlmC with PRC-barrel domain
MLQHVIAESNLESLLVYPGATPMPLKSVHEFAVPYSSVVSVSDMATGLIQ